MERNAAMNNSQNCNAKFLSYDKSTAISLQHLMGNAALAHLEIGERDQLESVHWLVRTIGKGQSIIDQGEDRETVYIILSGWAFRYQTLSDGKRQILDFVFDGTLVGFGSGKTNSYGVDAVTNCRVASLPQIQFRRLLNKCPSLAIQVAEHVSDSEMRAHEHMTSLGRRGARERIAGLIVELTSRSTSSEPPARHKRLELPITQIMIGDALGLSNEHVCRVLGKLAHDGVVAFNRHTLEVLDAVTLIREAGMELDDHLLRHRELELVA
jgi:CRP/FNR family transcriptional regulator, anaerobic regulatory protein